MPVENPSIEAPNEAYVDSLNPDWPTGADFPSDGDNHIRGIKNVLKQTFRNLAGPVYLTAEEMNSGSKLLEAGTVCLFYQQTAPTGWQRVDPTVGSRMLVLSTGTTGIEGGSDDPILNNKIPSHTHDVTGNTGYQSANHTHSVSLGGGGHEHVYVRTDVAAYNLQLQTNLSNTQTFYAPAQVAAATGGGSGGQHSHSGTSGANSANHYHGFNVTSNANSDAANWAPRHSVCLMARRDEWADPAP